MNACLLCGISTQKIDTPPMHGVTSDGRPWPDCGCLRWCPGCGHVQKETGHAWQENIDAIYRTYRTFAIPGSKDHQVFLGGGNIAVPRFHALIERLRMHIAPDTHGSLLDYGCGDGNFLQAFATFFPQWELHGHEYGPEHKDNVLEVAGVRSFSCGSVSHVEGDFDGISMQHVLEHLLDPLATLQALTRHLKEGGWFFTQVPTFWNDPFELMIVDHCSHFTEAMLHNLLVGAQLENFQNTREWIPKNVGFVSRRSRIPQVALTVNKEATLQRLSGCLQWLAELPPKIVEACGTARIGILGTSNAATWTASMLRGRTAFFVDEDPAHWGCTHLGLPVMPPEQTTDEDRIFVAFAPPLARNIAERLNASCPGRFFSVPWTLCN